MDRWQNRVAVVTGVSSGIGSAIAKDMVKAGLIVVALARRKERVDALRSTLPEDLQKKFHSIKCDVSNVDSVNEAFDWIEETLGGVDILVNNAGTHIPGQLVTMDVADVQQVVQTNIMGVVHCTQRAYKSMKERDVGGHVLIVNSVLGHSIFNAMNLGTPQLNIYPPTKYAVTGITEILRQEFRDAKTNIKITSISPGIVDTEILPDELRKAPMLNPEDISAGVMYAIGTPPHVQVHELTIKPMGEAI